MAEILGLPVPPGLDSELVPSRRASARERDFEIFEDLRAAGHVVHYSGGRSR